MTREERELSIEYLEKIKEDYIEGNAYERHPLPEYYAIENAIKALEQEPKTGSLDDAREDFMHDVYNELDFLPTNEEANRIIDIFDRVTSSIEQAPRWIPVTERLPEEMFGCLVTVWDANPKTGEEFENILPEFAGYDGETWNGADGKPIAFEVVAWLPLPEAYKAEGEV